MTTTLGAAAGCLGTAAIGFVEKQYIDPGYVYNGVLAGLVSITSPCAVVSPFGAIVVGLIGSLVYVGASKGVKAAGTDRCINHMTRRIPSTRRRTRLIGRILHRY